MENDDVEVFFCSDVEADIQQLASIELAIIIALLYDEYVEWHGGLLQKVYHGWYELVQMFLSVLLFM